LSWGRVENTSLWFLKQPVRQRGKALAMYKLAVLATILISVLCVGWGGGGQQKALKEIWNFHFTADNTCLVFTSHLVMAALCVNLSHTSTNLIGITWHYITVIW
jgi:ABC-type uncharacterized transport system permease subunit